MLWRDIFSCETLDDAIATARAAWEGWRRHSCRGTQPRACVACRGRDRSFSLSCIFILFSCCAPFTLNGCLGGQIIGANASAGSLQARVNNVNFGSVPLGTTTTTSISLVNQGSAAAQVSQVSLAGQSFTVSGAGDLPITVAAGHTLNLSVGFSPAATGIATGELTIASDAAAKGVLVVGLSGTGTATNAPNPPELSSFSCVDAAVTGPASDSCTVALSTAAASGGFTISLTSDNAAVSVPASITVAAGAATGSFTATITAVSTAQAATLTASASGVVETFALQLGVALPGLSINAPSIAFGNVSLNTPATQSVTLSSTGTAGVTVSLANVIGSGFTISGATFPLTLNSSESATISVQFDPTVAGAATGTLTIVSTSLTNPTVTIGLSGTGVTATAYHVNLSWDAPPSSPDPVAGYNVYRSPSDATSYVQLNSTVITQTTYVDSNVQDGQTYNYIVESVDATGIESAPSNTAVVPVL